MAKTLKSEVRERAANRCEYCHIPEAAGRLRHVLDHIIAQQHLGPTVRDNLALACGQCNLSKGPNVSGIDPVTGTLTPLFNPRKDVWSAHFRWKGALIEGVSAIERVTVIVLAMNEPLRVAARAALIDEGLLITD